MMKALRLRLFATRVRTLSSLSVMMNEALQRG